VPASRQALHTLKPTSGPKPYTLSLDPVLLTPQRQHTHRAALPVCQTQHTYCCLSTRLDNTPTAQLTNMPPTCVLHGQ
jgi:hypothetical protein